MSYQVKKTILLVEDEVIIAMNQSRTIENFGYRVVTAHSSGEFWNVLNDNPEICLILMDIDLGPGSDGTELAQEVLKRHNIPIVFLTSHAEQKMVDRVRGITRYGYVIKNSGDFVLQSSIEMAFDLFDAHQKTLRSEFKFRAMFEQAAIGVIISDLSGEIMDVNECFCRMTGFIENDLLHKHMHDISCPDELIHEYEMVKKCLSGEINTFKTNKRFICSSGEFIWTTFAASLVRNELNEPEYFLGVVENISDHKTALAEIHRQRSMSQMYLDLAATVIVAVDNQGCITMVNPAACQILGYREDELLYKNWFDTCLPESVRPELMKDFFRLMQGDVSLIKYYEKPVLSKTGNERLIRWHNAVLTDPDGNVTGVISSGEDITDRRKLEDELKTQNCYYKSIYENSEISIFIVNVTEDGRYVYEGINPTHEKLMGISNKDVAGQTTDFLGKWLGKKTVKYIIALYDECVNTERTQKSEFQIKSGPAAGWWFSTLIPLKNENGRVFRLIGSSIIIDKFKEAETKLRASEHRFRTLYEQAGIGIGYFSLEGEVLYLNRKAAKHMGGRPAEFIGTNIGDHEPETLGNEYLRRIKEAGDLGKTIEYEDCIALPSGSGWLLNKFTSIRDEEGAVQGVQVISEDITKMKETELALIDSETKYRSLFENINQALALHEIITDADGNPVDFIYLDVNPMFEKTTKLKKSELLGRRVSEVFPAFEKEWINLCGRVALTGKSEFVVGFSKFQSNYWEVSAYSPKRGQFAVTLADKTKRIHTEQELKKSKEVAERYLNIAAEIIITLDPTGTITMLNDKGHQFLGYFPGELVGKNWFEQCIPDSDQTEIRNVFTQMTQGNLENAESYDNQVITHTGELKTVSWYNTRLFDEKGEISGLLCSGLDITDKIEADKQIRKLLKEKELILKEVHHRMKNNLNNTMSILNLQMHRMGEGPAAEALRDAGGRLRSMSILYEKFIYSDDYQTLPASVYLDSLIDEISTQFGVNRKRTVQKNIDEFILDMKTWSVLGIAVNELVTNAFKYALNNAKEGKIQITAEACGSQIRVAVHDSGPGLPEAVLSGSESGLGLDLVNMLVNQLNGSFHRENDNGACLEIVFTNPAIIKNKA